MQGTLHVAWVESSAHSGHLRVSLHDLMKQNIWARRKVKT